jgi:hypothetical protein
MGDRWSALELFAMIVEGVIAELRFPVLRQGGVGMLLVRRLSPDCGGLPVDHWIMVYVEREPPSSAVSPFIMAGDCPQLKTRFLLRVKSSCHADR